MSIRSRLLHRAFELLYGPLVFLHEPAGACLFGPSWHGRRIAVADRLHGREGPLLDLGCGSGRLLAAVDTRTQQAVGVDVSVPMLKSAVRRGGVVVQASAAVLPFGNAEFGAVVCSYPGNWIREPDVWSEIGRVVQPGGTVTILFGGTVTRGRLSRVRSTLIRILYGRMENGSVSIGFPLGTVANLNGSLVSREDRWGTVYQWEGSRIL
jgi:SAM-dependent methyltransferase